MNRFFKLFLLCGALSASAANATQDDLPENQLPKLQFKVIPTSPAFDFNSLPDPLFCVSGKNAVVFLSPVQIIDPTTNILRPAVQHPDVKKYLSYNLYQHDFSVNNGTVISNFGENQNLYRVSFSLQFHNPIEQKQLNRQKTSQDKGNYTDLHIQFG